MKGSTTIPTDWNEFLKNDLNKTELFEFLADSIQKTSFEFKKVIVTKNENALIAASDFISTTLSKCFQEEADTRLVFHVMDGIQSDKAETIVVRTVNTDVLVIFIALYSFLKELSPHDLNIWLLMGISNDTEYINVGEIADVIGKDKAQGLMMFHTLSGTSFLAGKGKKSFWKAWAALPEATEVLSFCYENPFVELPVDMFNIVETFFVVLFDLTSDTSDINEIRRKHFMEKGRPTEFLPPTHHALIEHVKRCQYQASIWATSTTRQKNLPDPTLWGWEKHDAKDMYVPYWTTKDIASKECSFLVKCSCKTTCGNKRCSCSKNGWKCTALCNCTCVISPKR